MLTKTKVQKVPPDLSLCPFFTKSRSPDSQWSIASSYSVQRDIRFCRIQLTDLKPSTENSTTQGFHGLTGDEDAILKVLVLLRARAEAYDKHCGYQNKSGVIHISRGMLTRLESPERKAATAFASNNGAKFWYGRLDPRGRNLKVLVVVGGYESS